MLQQEVTQKVSEFYASLPFNLHGTAEQAVKTLRRENPVASYRNLDELLKTFPRTEAVLEIGCGAGWFSNAVAFYYGLNVVAIDLCEGALQRSSEVSRALGVEKKTRFISQDLFEIERLGQQFLLVNSLGVLHHTFDCEEALRRVSLMARPGGYLHLGLYHQYGREPFLQLFQSYREQMASVPDAEKKGIERKAFELYKDLNRQVADEVFLYSWFRDQVLHPHETQHTLRQVHGWLGSLGFTCLSTSLNGFKPVSDWEEAFQAEKAMRDLSVKRNGAERKYFPGFFTVLARKESGWNS